MADKLIIDDVLPVLQKLLSPQQVELGNMLLELNQPGAANDYQNLAQVARLNPSYARGRLVSYAKQLMADSKAGKNPYHRFATSVPSAEVSTLSNKKFLQFEEAGVREARKAAFVLVAGGLRERLSYYDGIKVALPRESTTGTCFLRHHIEYILALQEFSCRLSQGDFTISSSRQKAPRVGFIATLKIVMKDCKDCVRRGFINYINGVYERQADRYEAMGLPRDLKKPDDPLWYRKALSNRGL